MANATLRQEALAGILEEFLIFIYHTQGRFQLH